MTAPRMTLPRGAIMRWGNLLVSDHNRSELSIDIERIETAKRMANGTMRKYIVADKHKFDLSWEDLPGETGLRTMNNGSPVLDSDGEYTYDRFYTVDGGMGGERMYQFYEEGAPFVMELQPNLKASSGQWQNPKYRRYLVFISDFSYDITRRGRFDFWNINVTLEEV